MVLTMLDTDFSKANNLMHRRLGSIAIEFRQTIAEAIASERERCALVAEHLNGWGDKKGAELAQPDGSDRGRACVAEMRR